MRLLQGLRIRFESDSMPEGCDMHAVNSNTDDIWDAVHNSSQDGELQTTAGEDIVCT